MLNEKTEVKRDRFGQKITEKVNEAPLTPGTIIEVRADDFAGTKQATIVSGHKFGPAFGYTAQIGGRNVHVNKGFNGQWFVISRVYRGS